MTGDLPVIRLVMKVIAYAPYILCVIPARVGQLLPQQLDMRFFLIKRTTFQMMIAAQMIIAVPQIAMSIKVKMLPVGA